MRTRSGGYESGSSAPDGGLPEVEAGPGPGSGVEAEFRARRGGKTTLGWEAAWLWSPGAHVHVVGDGQRYCLREDPCDGFTGLLEAKVASGRVD